MQIVEMMILPLIISSVISALAQTRAAVAGRMGLLTVAYYMTTTFLSTFVSFYMGKNHLELRNRQEFCWFLAFTPEIRI